MADNPRGLRRHRERSIRRHRSVPLDWNVADSEPRVPADGDSVYVFGGHSSRGGQSDGLRTPG